MPGGGGCNVSAPMSPPPHALGCHQRLGARPLREGISLTLLHGSCCGVGDRCGPEGCCPGGQRRLSLCPRTWLCTLCWGSGEQSCLLTVVGGNRWAVIPPGAGWGVQGTAATLGLTAVSQKPRASPVLAALSWPLRCGTCGAQAGGGAAGNPRVRKWVLPLRCITGPVREPFGLESACGQQDGNVSVSRIIPQGPWALAAPQPDPKPAPLPHCHVFLLCSPW